MLDAALSVIIPIQGRDNDLYSFLLIVREELDSFSKCWCAGMICQYYKTAENNPKIICIIIFGLLDLCCQPKRVLTINFKSMTKEEREKLVQQMENLKLLFEFHTGNRVIKGVQSSSNISMIFWICCGDRRKTKKLSNKQDPSFGG